MSSGASYKQLPAEGAYARDTDLLVDSPPSYDDVASSQHSPPPQYQQPADAQQHPPAPPQGVTHTQKAFAVYLEQPSPQMQPGPHIPTSTQYHIAVVSLLCSFVFLCALPCAIAAFAYARKAIRANSKGSYEEAQRFYNKSRCCFVNAVVLIVVGMVASFIVAVLLVIASQ